MIAPSRQKHTASGSVWVYLLSYVIPGVAFLHPCPRLLDKVPCHFQNVDFFLNCNHC